MQDPAVPLGKRIGWRAEVIGFQVGSFLLRLLPVDAASAFGGWFFRTFGPLTRAARTVERNLRLAFPRMDTAERARITAAQWDSCGRYFTELTMMDRLTVASGRVEVVGAERLAAIAASGQPTVFISGHLSNCEIMSSVILEAGIDCVITYRAANNPLFNAAMMRTRARYGVKLFAAKGAEGTRGLITAMNAGRSVALMNDQKNNGGVAAPFFGQPAHTASGPTKLALRSGGVLQPMSVQRLQGARFRVTAHEPIVLERTGDRAADVEAGVVRINAFIEDRVRERPEEWFWVHKRWSDAAYATLDA